MSSTGGYVGAYASDIACIGYGCGTTSDQIAPAKPNNLRVN
jgi:hypothetical protein